MFSLKGSRFWIFSGLVLFLGCSSNVEEPAKPVDDYVNAELLIDAKELHDRIQSGDSMLLVDARADFGSFISGHIPNAIYFHARRELNDTTNVIENFMV